MAKIMTFAQIQNEINKKIVKALEITADTIYDVIQRHVEAYYTEYQPKLYKRTYQFRDANTISKITQENGNYHVTVGFPDNYLKLIYQPQSAFTGDDEDEDSSEFTGTQNGKLFTGLDCLYCFNNKMHGYMEKAPGGDEFEHRYWDEALEEIDDSYGGIQQLFISNLKSQGLNITKK